MRKLNITKIIHDTYVKEIDRFHRKQQEEERRRRQLSEEKRVAEAELAKQQELAAAEEEKKRQTSIMRKQMNAKRTNKQQRGRKPLRGDTMGMNSPKKLKVATKPLRSATVKPLMEIKKVNTVAAIHNDKKA